MNVNVSSVFNDEELKIEKPEVYRDPFEIMKDYFNTDEIPNKLIIFGFFSIELVLSMTEDDIEMIELNDVQRQEFDTAVQKMKKEIGSQQPPVNSQKSSAPLSPTIPVISTPTLNKDNEAVFIPTRRGNLYSKRCRQSLNCFDNVSNELSSIKELSKPFGTKSFKISWNS